MIKNIFDILTLSQAKQIAASRIKNANAMVELARKTLVDKLKKHRTFKGLMREIERKLDANEGDLHFDEHGMLARTIDVELADMFCKDDLGNYDEELARAVLEEACEMRHFKIDGQTARVSECYGEPTIVNFPPERNCYAIYSQELGLKLNRNDVVSEEHALMLVEQAMRSKGIFGDVVRPCERGNEAFHLEIPKTIRDASDAELAEMISKVE